MAQRRSRRQLRRRAAGVQSPPLAPTEGPSFDDSYSIGPNQSLGNLETTIDDAAAAADVSFANSSPSGAVEWTRNQDYSVLKLPAAPTVLQSPEVSSFVGYVDQTSGAALLLSNKTAFIWDYNSSDHIPTTLSFPLSQEFLSSDSSSLNTPPLGVLVSPAAGSSEPGLLIVHRTLGLVAYWDSVGTAVTDGLLFGKNVQQTATLPLHGSEQVQHLQPLEPAGALCTTTNGRYIMISFRDSAGKSNLSFVTLRNSTSTSIWDGLKGALSFSSLRRNVVSIKPGRLIGRSMIEFAVINSSGALSIWHSTRSALSCSLIFEKDLNQLLLNAVMDIYPRALSSFTVHDVDFLYTKSSQQETSVLILASFVQDDANGQEQIYYLLYTLKLDPIDTDVISTYRITSYTSMSARPPRLVVPAPYETAFVVFSHAVVMIEPLNASPSFPSSQAKYEDMLAFVPGIEILVTGIEHGSNDALPSTIKNPALTLITRGAGVLRLERFLHHHNNNNQKSITSAPSDQTTTEANQLKSKIEQAVFYGFLQDNPLNFGMIHVEEKLDVDMVHNVLENIASSILDSSCRYLPMFLSSVSEHFQLRCEALEQLCQYAHSNLLSVMTIDTRLNLLGALEKCHAAFATWRVYDSWLSNGDSLDKQFAESILTEAVSLSTRENKKMQKDDEDDVRSWMRERVQDIGSLLVDVASVVLNKKMKKKKSNSTSNDHRPYLLGNEIVLSSLEDAAYSIRHEYLSRVFELDQVSSLKSSTPPWTSTVNIINSVHSLLEKTKLTLNDGASSGKRSKQGADPAADKLANQLVQLVDLCCTLYKERSTWCAFQLGNDLFKNQGIELTNRQFQERSSWMKSLVQVGKSSDAFRIAEKYQDFQSLVELCDDEYNDKTGGGGGGDLDKRINFYFETYGYSFAVVLYQFYVNNHRYYSLLVNFPQFQNQYLDRFLESSNLVSYSWIRDITCGRFLQASKTLGKLATSDETSIINKRLELSIGKLSLMAAGQIQSTTSTTKDFDNQLEVANAQLTLCSQLVTYMENNPGASRDVVLSLAGPKQLSDRGFKGFAQLLELGLARILDNDIMKETLLIDILTLVNLQELVGDENLPAVALSQYHQDIQVVKCKQDMADNFINALSIVSYLESAEYLYQRHGIIATLGRPTIEKTGNLQFDIWRKTIWRRCILMDDWISITDTKDKSDFEVGESVHETQLYYTLLHYFTATSGNKLPPSPPPRLSEMSFNPSSSSQDNLQDITQYVTRQYQQVSKDSINDISKDYQHENKLLDEIISSSKLSLWYDGLVEDAKTTAEQQQSIDINQPNDNNNNNGNNWTMIDNGNNNHHHHDDDMAVSNPSGEYSSENDVSMTDT